MSEVKEIPFQIDGYHVDRNGTRIDSGVKLKHDNGDILETWGTGMYMPGDGYHLLVSNTSKPVAGIAGTSVTYVDTRNVVVINNHIFLKIVIGVVLGLAFSYILAKLS